MHVLFGISKEYALLPVVVDGDATNLDVVVVTTTAFSHVTDCFVATMAVTGSKV